MSRYRGPRLKKKDHRLGAFPGLTHKKSRTGNDLRNQSYSGEKKISISYLPRRKTKITFSLWSYRMTISKICLYCQKRQGVNRLSFTPIT